MGTALLGFSQPSSTPFPGTDEGVLSPLGHLFQGLRSHGVFGLSPAQEWDATANHYRGTGVQGLRFPQIVKAGYRSFSLEDGSDFDERHSLNNEKPDYVLQQGLYAMARNPGRVRRIYTLDDSGWIRTQYVTQMHPEMGFYSELRDSMFYDFHEDGSMTFTCKRQQIQSFDFRPGNSDCRPVGSRSTVRNYATSVTQLDRWNNIVACEWRVWEQRDTCKPTIAQHNIRRFIYDPIGRLIRTTDSAVGSVGRAPEVEIDYIEIPYATFATTIAQHFLYAPLRESVVDLWLRKHAGLMAVIQRRIATEFWVYDQNLRTAVFKPDSPNVRIDSVFMILNSQREQLVSRPFQQRAPFEFFISRKDAQNGSAELWLQQLPAPPDPAQGPVTVCEPLAVTASKFYVFQTGMLGKDTLRRFYDQASTGDVYRMERTRKQAQFSVAFPAKLDPHGLQGMELRDSRGLTTWLWLNDHCYKLTYR